MRKTFLSPFAIISPATTIMLTILFLMTLNFIIKVGSTGSNDVEQGLDKEKSIFVSYCYQHCTAPVDEKSADNDSDTKVYKEGFWEKYPKSKCNSKESQNQSPIDIQSSQVWNKDKPAKIEWRFFHHYNMYHPKTVVRNDGILFSIDAKSTNHILSFSVHYGPEEEDVAVYYLSNIHIHWGTNSEDGSEHAIDGKKYAAEVHLVHTKDNVTYNNYRDKNAGRLGSKHDNIFVISVLIQEGERSQNFAPIENVLRSVINPLTNVEMGREFSMFALISKSLATGEGVYYSYHGSLTGPTCDEIVTWAVFRDPLQVSKRQLDSLRTNVAAKDQYVIVNNFRKLQPSNGRNITAYIPTAAMIGGPSGILYGANSTPELPFNFYIITVSIVCILVFANNL